MAPDRQLLTWSDLRGRAPRTFECRCLVLASLIVCSIVGLDARGHAQEYLIGPQDVLGITVWNQLDLSGKFTVEPDGTFIFPLLGRINAEGLTPAQIAADLKKRLADGYFRNPELTVAVEQYQSQRFFVLGEVRQPGPYPLKGKMTLVEALALAGSTSTNVTEIVVVRRSRSDDANGSALPDDQGTELVVRIDFAQLQGGDLSKNIELNDGDTVFVPRPQSVFVAGQVRSPGAYPVGSGTTVLQMLTLAGGVTDRGASNRVKVIRLVKGKSQQSSIKMTDLVLPGDTILVPERYF